MLLPNLARAAIASISLAVIVSIANGSSSFTTLPSGTSHGRISGRSTTSQRSTQSFDSTTPSTSGTLSGSIEQSLSSTKSRDTTGPFSVTVDSHSTIESSRIFTWDLQSIAHSTVILTSTETSHTPTLAPITTPHITSRFVSQVSSVSSELSGLNLALTAWKSDPSGHRSNTLKQINRIENDVWSLVSETRSSSSSECGSPNGTFYNGTADLSCILEVLDEVQFVVEHGITHDVDDLISSLTLPTSDRGEKVNNRRDNNNGGQMSTKESPHASSYVSNDTTASGNSSSRSLTPRCARTSCGSWCNTKRRPQPLIGAPMVPFRPNEIDECSEEITQDLSSSPHYSEARNLPRADIPDPQASEEDEFEDMVKIIEVADEWLNIREDVSGAFHSFEDDITLIAGINGLFGCTVAIVVSDKGAYLTHIWEDPVFVNHAHVEIPLDIVGQQTYELMLKGNSDVPSIKEIIGTEQEPGPLNIIHNPKVFVVTPFVNTPMGQEPTEIEYVKQAELIGSNLAEALGLEKTDTSYMLIGYARASREESFNPRKVAGKLIVEWVEPREVDPGKWSIWVNGKVVAKSTDPAPTSTGQEGLVKAGLAQRDISQTDLEPLDPERTDPDERKELGLSTPQNLSALSVRRRSTTVPDAASDATNSSTTRLASSNRTGTIWCALGRCGEQCTRPTQPLYNASMTTFRTEPHDECAEDLETTQHWSSTAHHTDAKIVPRGGDIDGTIDYNLFTDMSMELEEGFHWFHYGGISVTSAFHPFPNEVPSFAGIKGLYGCVAIIIVSSKGLYMAHVFEIPVFAETLIEDDDESEVLRIPLEETEALVFPYLIEGTLHVASLRDLTGTTADPGPLNKIYEPQIFVISPWAFEQWTDDKGMEHVKYFPGEFQYPMQTQMIASRVSEELGFGSNGANWVGYSRNAFEANLADSVTGKAIVRRLIPPDGLPPEYGKWYLFFEGRIIAESD